MTGSLHIKNDIYYMVLNVYTNGKRKQKWVSTGLSAKGYNKRKADKLLQFKIDDGLETRTIVSGIALSWSSLNQISACSFSLSEVF